MPSPRAQSLVPSLLTRLPATWQRIAAGFALVLFGTAIIALSAKVQVPFWPIPMTMQTFAIMLLAGAYGARLGGATMITYLAQGAMGLPVFAGTPERGLGLAYMMGPTGGYLLGFTLAAILVGWMVQRGLGRSLLRMILLFWAAMLPVYGLGVLWLSGFVGLEPAFEAGVLPFLMGDAAKCGLAAMVLTVSLRAFKTPKA